MTVRALAREISEQLRTLDNLAEPDSMERKAMERLKTALIALQDKGAESDFYLGPDGGSVMIIEIPTAETKAHPPWANGTQYMDWECRNCHRCAHYDPNDGEKCPISETMGGVL